VAAACTLLLSLAPATVQAIIGGEPAARGRWPWMVAVLRGPARSAAKSFWCGATVIAPRRVLTAGHCVKRVPTSALHVLVGRTRLTTHAGRRIRVTGVAVLPGFVSHRHKGLDAAVLTLARAVRVPPVRLARHGDRAAWRAGTSAWTMGWGQLNARLTRGREFYYADRLREVAVPIVGDDACERVYGLGAPGVIYRRSSIVCAGFPRGGAGTCFGDSGGPLVVPDGPGWLEVGIVQSGDACGERRYFDTYTRVDALRGFPLRRHLVLQPDPAVPPRIHGRLVAGHLLRCTRGRWRGSPARYAFRWARVAHRRIRRFGRPGRVHRVSAIDAHRGIACLVTARNAGGVNRALSRPLLPHKA